jgi:hypothetical protein
MQQGKDTELDREIWRARRHLRKLEERKAEEAALDWDGRPFRANAFPRPHMIKDPEIRRRLGVDPERPEVNPFCQCLNYLFGRVSWEENIALDQRLRPESRGEVWIRTHKDKAGNVVREREVVRWYALATARAGDIALEHKFSVSLVQKVLRAARECDVIKYVGRTETKISIYAVGFWVSPGDPFRRRAVPFAMTPERIRLLRRYSLRP